MKKLSWGILSTGVIARRFAKALSVSTAGTLTAVASREQAKASAFAAEFSVPHAHGNYDDLLTNPAVEAVYIATPHPQHAEWTIRAARAGKHILCEKPAAMTYPEAEAMIQAVKENNVFFMEAFMYRCHPQTAQILEVIKSGILGEVRLLQATFSFDAGYQPESRLFANALGGGGILDVGCYTTSMVRLLAGAVLGQNHSEPLELKATGLLDPQEGTDLLTTAVMKFSGGLLAQVTTGVQLAQDNIVRVIGRKGSLTVTSPWFAGAPGSKLILNLRETGETREFLTESKEDLYSYEIDLVAHHCQESQAPAPAMSWADTLRNMRVLDAWRQEIGVVYRTTVSG